MESQENWIPPQVMPMRTERALVTIIRIPLRSIPSAHYPKAMTDTSHIQSMRATVFLNWNSGVWTRRNIDAKINAMAQSGRLRKKSHLHCPELAKAPPTGGPIALQSKY